jgi:tRNA wybutosine-synthesizing protein 3
MTFEKEKKDFLIKKDKSKKGEIDKEIKDLVGLINSLPNYYTKSSCAGRIVLLTKKSDKKQEAQWLFVKHGPVGYKEIRNALKKIPKQEVWFKQEPLIMHVCCKTIESANKLLNITKGYFKRTGIIGIKRYVTLEIIGTDALDTLIAKDSKLLVSEEYLKVLNEESNKKLKRNSKKIKEYFKALTSF